MAFSEHTTKLVQKTWGGLSSQTLNIANDFMELLFEKYPHYRVHFSTDVNAQLEKFVSMLNILVNGLDYWDDIEPEIRKLGQRHVSYGKFMVEDYENVVDTLIIVLKKYSGQMPEEVEQAWVDVFAEVAGIMIQGAEELEKD